MRGHRRIIDNARARAEQFPTPRHPLQFAGRGTCFRDRAELRAAGCVFCHSSVVCLLFWWAQRAVELYEQAGIIVTQAVKNTASWIAIGICERLRPFWRPDDRAGQAGKSPVNMCRLHCLLRTIQASAAKAHFQLAEFGKPRERGTSRAMPFVDVWDSIGRAILATALHRAIA